MQQVVLADVPRRQRIQRRSRALRTSQVQLYLFPQHCHTEWLRKPGHSFDPHRLLVTPEGRAFLKIKAGAAGEKLADEYEKILKATGVTGYPFVKAKMQGKPGELANIVGRRVDHQKLLDLNAYLDALPAPKGQEVAAKLVAQGKRLFETNCTACHNSDQSKFVPPSLVELKNIWPGYQPKVAAQRQAPLSPVQDSPGIFDDKMIVVDASDRGEKRGVALPLLLDLARRNVFLHDASVTGGLDQLLSPERGEDAPHPFYFKDQREAVIGFLRSLDTGTNGSPKPRASSASAAHNVAR